MIKGKVIDDYKRENNFLSSIFLCNSPAMETTKGVTGYFGKNLTELLSEKIITINRILTKYSGQLLKK